MPGIRQRMRDEAEHGPEAHYEKIKSALALHLALQITWAFVSSAQAQSLAALACKDIEAVGGTPPRNLKALANIGCGGLYVKNCWRDFKKLLSEPKLTPPSSCYVPVKSKSVRGYEWDEMLFVDPHVLFADLYQDKAAWETHMLAHPRDAEIFWEEQVLACSPRLDGNPMLEVNDRKNLFVPFTLFGDQVPVTGVGKSWGKSMESWNSRSAVAKGSTTTITMLMCAIFACMMVEGLAIPYGGTMMLVST